MERIAQLMALTDDLAKLETQKRDVAMQHLLILSQEKALEESREKLEAAKGVLNATLDRIDVNFLALYQVSPAPVAAVVEEPKRTRGKKAKEAPAPEEKPVEDKAARRLAILQDSASPPCAKCHAASECSDCCKDCISPCDTKQECRKDSPPSICPKCEGEGMYIEDGIEDGGGETYCDCAAGVALKEKDEANVPADAPSNEEGKQEVAPAVGETTAQASEVAQYLPLDEAVGNCELCMGYGVIEGELYGEAALVPCTCEAGVKVKGGVVASCCDNCNIDDPDCASCHLPDMAADSPVEVDSADPPPCANGSCTANDPLKGEYCLRVTLPDRPGKDCKSFVPLDQCKHPLNRRSKQEDGSVTCALCGHAVRPAGSVDPSSGRSVSKEEAAPAPPEKTALQLKCTHPKVFREETAEGTVCKVCKLVLSGGGNRDCLPFNLEPEPWDEPSRKDS